MSVELAEHIAHAVTNRGFKLILNPTERCNLRCVYCYETFSSGRMSEAVIEGVLNLVERRCSLGLEWLEIEFFGGEPFAAWAAVRQLAAGIHEKCKKYKVALLGAATTNGTQITAERLAFLVENRFTSFQITLDGPKSIHDTRRVTQASGGTFDAIWRRLLMMKKSAYDLEVTIRLHFDPSTVEQLIQIPGFLTTIAKELFANDPRFRLTFNPIEPWTSSALPHFRSSSAKSEALKMLLNAAQAAGLRSSQLLQHSNALPTGESGHVVCYAARTNSFVIRSDGRIAKCTVAFEDDKNVIGHLLPSGELKIDRDRHMPWIRGLISGDDAALQCPAAGLIWGAG